MAGLILGLARLHMLKYVEVRYDVPGNDDIICNRDHSRDVLRRMNEADVDNRIRLPK